MHRLQPKNKICFQLKKNVNPILDLKKLKKKKWSAVKKNARFAHQIEKKPERLKHFYKRRLLMTQQFKYFYGCLPEYQLKNIFCSILKKSKGNKLVAFLTHLESRLDIILFRLRVAKSIYHAKQLISHKKIKVNGQVIKNNAIILKKGDVIEIENFDSSILKKNIPAYLEFNKFLKKIIFLKKPSMKEIEYPFSLNFSYVFEYLKKN